MHGNFGDTVEQQTQAALRHALPAEVSSHLRLVRTEVRQLQKKPSDQAGPETVAIVQIH